MSSIRRRFVGTAFFLALASVTPALADSHSLQAQTTRSSGSCHAIPGSCSHDGTANINGQVSADLSLSTLASEGVALIAPSDFYSLDFSGVSFPHVLESPAGHIVYTTTLRLNEATFESNDSLPCNTLATCGSAYIELGSDVHQSECSTCSFWGDQVVGQFRTNYMPVFRSGSEPNYSEVTINLIYGNCESGTIQPVPPGTIWVWGRLFSRLVLPQGGSGSFALTASATIESVTFQINSDLPTDNVFCS